MFGVDPDDKRPPAAEYGRMSKILSFAVSLSTLFSLAPAVASAGTRYAAPNGTGPVATCPQADPCDLADAMDYNVLRNGDEVVFGPGTYQDPDGYMGVSKRSTCMAPRTGLAP